MRNVLFDADAFLFIRKLSVLSLLAKTSGRWLMTGHIAHTELNDIADEIAEWRKGGRLEIHELPAKDPVYRRLRREGEDPGEAEAIAWASQLEPKDRPLFISGDKDARRCAQANGVSAGDVMDLIVEVVESGAIDRAALRDKVAVWDDKHQMLGRPNDYTTFDETFEKRKRARR